MRIADSAYWFIEMGQLTHPAWVNGNSSQPFHTKRKVSGGFF
jgi:hypothetical protein